MASVTEIRQQAEDVRPLRYRVHDVPPVQGAPEADWTEYVIETQLCLAHDAQSLALIGGLRSDLAVEVSILLELSDAAADYLTVGPSRAFEAAAGEYANQLSRIARMVRAA